MCYVYVNYMCMYICKMYMYECVYIVRGKCVYDTLIKRHMRSQARIVVYMCVYVYRYTYDMLCVKYKYNAYILHTYSYVH